MWTRGWMSVGFWREESLVCLAEWLQSLLNYSPAGKKKKSRLDTLPCSLESPDVCMNIVTNACGILSKERASSEDVLLGGPQGPVQTPGPGLHAPPLPVSGPGPGAASAEGYLRRP